MWGVGGGTIYVNTWPPTRNGSRRARSKAMLSPVTATRDLRAVLVLATVL